MIDWYQRTLPRKTKEIAFALLAVCISVCGGCVENPVVYRYAIDGKQLTIEGYIPWYYWLGIDWTFVIAVIMSLAAVWIIFEYILLFRSNQNNGTKENNRDSTG